MLLGQTLTFLCVRCNIMKRQLYILTIFLNVTFGTVFAQKSASINDITQLKDSIEVIMKQESITGLMVGITIKDSVLFSGGFGFAEIDTKRKVNDTTLFRMGSITKMFVSLGILKLVNEGKLKLDDELKKIAPEVPQQNKWEATNPVRIINLLEHTSGFDDIKLNQMYSLDTNETNGIDMMLIQKNSMICRWKPGERCAYSNPNYAILGYIIEKLAGVPYNKYLEKNILNPLGMSSSNFNLRSKYPQKDVKEYIVKGGKTIQVKSVTLLSGAYGALWSNANDMVKFLQMLLRNGSPLFTENTIAEMETAHSSLAAIFGQTNGYALGNMNNLFRYEKYPFHGHLGTAGTCFSTVAYNRKLEVGFVIASNSNNDNHRIEELIVSYLEQNLSANVLPIQTTDKKAMEPFLGRYQFESPRNEISAFSDRLQDAPQIYFEHDTLYFKPLFGNPEELVQTAPMTFALRGMNMPLICFTQNDEGKNVMMIWGNYYEQTSNVWAIFKRAIIIIAVLFILSSVILGIISLIGATLGKLSWLAIIPRIIPMISLILLVLAVLNLLEVKQYSYKLSELRSVSFYTLTIFLGTSAFGIISIASLFYSLKTFSKSNNSLFRIYLLLVSISFCFITTILWQNGWIGLRTWTL